MTMVLYEAHTTYPLLIACVDRMLRREEEDAVLLVAESCFKKYPNLHELDVLFSEIVIYRLDAHVNMPSKSLERYFHDLLCAYFPLSKSFNRIFSSCPHHAFGIFLAETDTPFVFCEEAAGLLSRPEIDYKIDSNKPVLKDATRRASALGLFDASNKNIVAKRCNLKAQVPGFQDPLAEDFDVLEKLEQLDASDRERIVDFFLHGMKLSCPPGATVLLTTHFANLERLSFSEQAELYQTLVDYFFVKDRLVIKTHPDDLMYYGQLFPEAEIIRKKFPSELMPFVFDAQPDCVATVSSMAIYNLRGHYPRVFELDTRYEQDFPMTHRYYAAVCVARRLGKTIRCIGVNEQLVEHLCETVFDDMPKIVCEDCTISEENELVLIGDLTAQGETGKRLAVSLLDALPPSSAAILLNPKEDYCWYDYDRKDIWNDMAPLTIQKTVRAPVSPEDNYASAGQETIFLYSKDKELLNMAKETVIEKDLPHVGLTITNMKLDKQEEKIKMLEGILAATEKRLLYYIEKERQAT